MAEISDDKATFQVERLAFFSDAVFAIAITLLALNVRPSAVSGSVTEGALRHALFAMMPSLVSFVVSFLVIGIFWRAHHRLFRWVRQHDDRLVSINLRLLLCVSFIPCPTAFFSLYAGRQTPIQLYCLTMVVTGLANYHLWLYLTRHPDLLDPATPHVEFLLARRRSLLIPMLFGTAAVLSFVNPLLSAALMMCVPLIMPLFTRFLRRRHAA